LQLPYHLEHANNFNQLRQNLPSHSQVGVAPSTRQRVRQEPPAPAAARAVQPQ